MARSFDGSTQGMESASSLDFTATDIVSVSFWFNPTTWPASATENIFELSTDLTAQLTGFQYRNFNSTTHIMDIWGNVGRVEADYNLSSLSTGDWHHYVCIFDKSAVTELDLYVDGSLQSPSSRPHTSDNTNNFGNHVLYFMSQASTTRWRDGQLADVAIWPSLLSGSNITSLAGGTLPSAISPAPDYYWKICGDASPEPATLGGIDLTLTGSPTKSDHPATISNSCTVQPNTGEDPTVTENITPNLLNMPKVFN